jgi:hypothetical protein
MEIWVVEQEDSLGERRVFGAYTTAEKAIELIKATYSKPPYSVQWYPVHRDEQYGDFTLSGTFSAMPGIPTHSEQYEITKYEVDSLEPLG